MKKVLITGKNSYIGTSVAEWLGRQPQAYEVERVSLRGKDWKQYSFCGYDTVFHVAGIAHADVSSASEETKQRYYEVNTQLTIEAAQKARTEGVRQFIFMSSMIVYGESGAVGQPCEITPETSPSPANFYGDSKWKAEQGILPLQTPQFRVAVLRPPMIYGAGSRGNYPMLASMARKLPLFPDLENQRSMLYVENLSEFVRLLIDQQQGGIFFPQNEDYVKTTRLVQQIAAVHQRRLYTTRLFNGLLHLLSRGNGTCARLTNKAFGNFTYAQEMSVYSGGNYRVCGFEESVRRTEEVHRCSGRSIV